MTTPLHARRSTHMHCWIALPQQEIDEIFKIFRVLGTPTEETWPGVHELPDFKDAFPKWAPRPLQEVPLLSIPSAFLPCLPYCPLLLLSSDAIEISVLLSH